MSSGTTREYTLGTHDAELERLGLQHRLWASVAQDFWNRAGLRAASTVVDLGSGPGFATVEMAELISSRGRVIAVDASQRYIDHLARMAAARGITNIDARIADVTKLPLADGSVDFVYARWVLCWVSDPAAVVREVARVLRPGGVFAVQDYFNWETCTLAPRSTIFDRIIRAAGESYRQDSADPNLVARLPAMLLEYGFTWRDIKPTYYAVRPTDLLWQWPTTFFATYVPRLVQRGLLSEEEHQEFLADWRRRSEDGVSFFCTPPVFDVIGVRG